MSAQNNRIRSILRAGSLTFGLSAIFLLILPDTFTQLLGLEPSESLDWAMRMISITLVALSGNMYSVSQWGRDESVHFSGWIMLVSAAGLGILTLLIPTSLTWFSVLYAAIGFGFSGAYALTLWLGRNK